MPYVETNLTVADFTRYFDAKRLGMLHFPNGRCWTSSVFPVSFHIPLHGLYRAMSGWRVNHTLVRLGDIVAVLAFGSAVRHPGYREIVYTRRKYFLFGDPVVKTRMERICPSDADFLVITGENLTREETIDPVLSHDNYGGAWLCRGGIHLINRGADQVIKGVRDRDTVSLSALQEGVPIFFDPVRFEILRMRTGIQGATPRKVCWDEDENGYLSGKIE